MSGIYVLDACALVASVKNERGAEKVLAAYRQAEHGEARILVNRINLLEVYYGFYREKGVEGKEPIHFHWIR